MIGRRELIAWGLLAALVVSLVLVWRHRLLEQGRADERARVADSVLHVKQTAIDSLLRVAGRRETVFLTRWLPRWDTLLVTTPPVTVRESVFVAVADSTIRSCSLALASCGEVQDGLVGLTHWLSDQVAQERKRQQQCRLLGLPCKPAAVVLGAAAAAAGYAVGHGARTP